MAAEGSKRALDARYRDYREGRYRLSRDERDQIGLRLAAKLGLSRVYAVDWNEEAPGDWQYYDWLSYGESHEQKAQVSAIRDAKRTLGIVPLGTQSIGTWLLAAQSSGNTCGEPSQLLRLGSHWRP